MKNLKRKKAQYVLEFALLFPFIIAFVVFIVQDGWILNLNFKFQNAINQATTLSLGEENMQGGIVNRTRLLMTPAPNLDNINVEFVEIQPLDTVAVIGNYEFNTFFNLADLLFPKRSNMTRYTAFSFINSAYTKNEGYTLNNSNLDELQQYLQNSTPEVSEDIEEIPQNDEENIEGDEGIL